MDEQLKNKTGKREYAFLIVCCLGWLIYADNTEMMQIVIWPFLSFVATSAGLHIYDRTTSNRREMLEAHGEKP